VTRGRRGAGCLADPVLHLVLLAAALTAWGAARTDPTDPDATAPPGDGPGDDAPRDLDAEDRPRWTPR
jgi:hypothetical protein